MLAHSTRFAFCASKMCICILMSNHKVSKTKRLHKPSSSAPCQYKIAPWYTITCGLLGFFLPPFVLHQMYVKYLIGSKNACETQHCNTGKHQKRLDFLTELKGAQLVSPSCLIPPPSQIHPEDSAFTCQDFCLWALKSTHTGFQVKQCQGETAAINTINRNPAARWLPAWLKADPSFQERSPPAPDAAAQSTCSWGLPCHQQRGSHF